jgi:hypothetical protein
VEKQLTPKRVGYTTSSMTGSMATSARTRQLVPGSDVRTVDSGCGGMAGLFGYEEGHYEVSMKMGERRLFPAVREAEGRVIVAPEPPVASRSWTAPAAAPCTRPSTWPHV